MCAETLAVDPYRFSWIPHHTRYICEPCIHVSSLCLLSALRAERPVLLRLCILPVKLKSYCLRVYQERRAHKLQGPAAVWSEDIFWAFFNKGVCEYTLASRSYFHAPVYLSFVRHLRVALNTEQPPRERPFTDMAFHLPALINQCLDAEAAHLNIASKLELCLRAVSEKVRAVCGQAYNVVLMSWCLSTYPGRQLRNVLVSLGTWTIVNRCALLIVRRVCNVVGAELRLATAPNGPLEHYGAIPSALLIAAGNDETDVVLRRANEHNVGALLEAACRGNCADVVDALMTRFGSDLCRVGIPEPALRTRDTVVEMVMAACSRVHSDVLEIILARPDVVPHLVDRSTRQASVLADQHLLTRAVSSGWPTPVKCKVIAGVYDTAVVRAIVADHRAIEVALRETADPRIAGRLIAAYTDMVAQRANQPHQPTSARITNDSLLCVRERARADAFDIVEAFGVAASALFQGAAWMDSSLDAAISAGCHSTVYVLLSLGAKPLGARGRNCDQLMRDMLSVAVM